MEAKTYLRGDIYRRGLAACCAVAALVALGGCFGAADRTVADVAPVSAAPVELRAAPGAQPPIRTVRPSSRVAAEGDATARDAGIPSPSEIFDFHPPGSKPEAWRQPFIIDPNDGPLSGYVRRMDAELADSNKQIGAAARPPAGRKTVCPSTGPVGTISTKCGENEAARP